MRTLILAAAVLLTGCAAGQVTPAVQAAQPAVACVEKDLLNGVSSTSQIMQDCLGATLQTIAEEAAVLIAYAESKASVPAAASSAWPPPELLAGWRRAYGEASSALAIGK